jgi:sirohydrochlorin ferrochelatase
MNSYTTEARTATGRDLFKDKKKKKAKEVSSDIPTAIQLGEHGRYQIKSGRLAGEFVARAFPKPPTNARGLIAEARGASEEEAIAALHDVIDARETRRTEGRRIDETTGVSVPSFEEYLEALDQIALSRPQHAMLTALALSEDDGLSEQRMANAAGYKSRSSANRAFAAAGLLIASYLAIEMPAEEQPENLAGSSVLGLRGVPKKDDAPGNWILFQELREAVRSIA